MPEPEAGRMIRSASDGCPGTIQRVRRDGGQVFVRWEDGTTSQEPTGEERGWEYMDGWGHVCGPPCWCPEHEADTWYHPATGTHACQRVDCRYAGGVEAERAREADELRARRASLPPRWEGSHPLRGPRG